MKDPAFLFYSQDFLAGTIIMPFEDRGRYITILCYQHQNGRLTEETIRLLVGSFTDILRLKFRQDENGLFYNERLEVEIAKRAKFTESRANNGKLGGRPIKNTNLNKTDRLKLGYPKDNLTVNENVNVNDNINNMVLSEKNTISEKFEVFRKQFKGTKNSFDIEFKNFLKKNTTNIVDLLLPGLEKEKQYRAKAAELSAFIPEWKHLSTWINQQCWNQDFEELTAKPTNGSTIKIDDKMYKTPEKW